MKYHDPERPRLGDRPAWFAAPNLALPDLVVEVAEEPQKFNLRCLLATSLSSGRWVELRDLTLPDVGRILMYWSEDPEGTIVNVFKAEAPSLQRFYEKREKPKEKQVFIMAGNVEVPEGL